MQFGFGTICQIGTCYCRRRNYLLLVSFLPMLICIALMFFWCLAYVLDPKLQDGKKLPKWTPLSHRGQYLGLSPNHSTLVGRILNLHTGSVSPQFHVVHDNLFTTVPNTENGSIFDDNFRMDTGMVDMVPLIIWLV
jgi:hypothetical protein